MRVRSMLSVLYLMYTLLASLAVLSQSLSLHAHVSATCLIYCKRQLLACRDRAPTSRCVLLSLIHAEGLGWH